MIHLDLPIALSTKIHGMEREPRDPSVAAMARATVRVADASGVVFRNGRNYLIATAAHVVKDADAQSVRKGALFGDGQVISRNEHLNLALIVPPLAFEAVAIDLVEPSEDALPGDSIWGCGFPRGWSGTHPVIAPRTIAGVGEKCWVSIDGSWGASGGPLCRLWEGRPRVIGILLGNASHASEALNTWINTFAQHAAESRVAIERFRKRPALPTLEELIEPLEPDGLEEAMMGPSSPEIQRQLADHANAMAGMALARLIEEHFRTGFLRFAPVADVRKLL